MRRLKAFFNSLSIDRETRLLCYQVLAVQISAGLTPMQAVVNIGRVLKSNPLAKLAAADAQGEAHPDGVFGRWRELGLAPPQEAALLVYGDRTGTLVKVLESIESAAAAARSFTRAVLVPNLYYLGVLVFLIFGASFYVEFLHMIVGDLTYLLDDQIGHTVAKFVVDWRINVLFGLAAAMVLYQTFARYATGGLRKLAGPLMSMSDGLFAVRFLKLSEILSAHGMGPLQILDVGDNVLRSPHCRATLRKVKRDVEAGMDYLEALQGRVLNSELAQMLQALVPQGDRSRMPGAFRAVATALGGAMDQRFAKLKVLLRIVVLSGVGVMISTWVLSMYSTVEAFTAVVTAGN